MSQENKIEYSNQREKFTAAEIRAKVAESKKFWSSPEGIAAKRKQEVEARNRKKGGVKFPDLAKRSGTKPSIAQWSEKLDRISNKKI